MFWLCQRLSNYVVLMGILYMKYVVFDGVIICEHVVLMGISLVLLPYILTYTLIFNKCLINCIGSAYMEYILNVKLNICQFPGLVKYTQHKYKP